MISTINFISTKYDTRNISFML